MFTKNNLKPSNLKDNGWEKEKDVRDFPATKNSLYIN